MSSAASVDSKQPTAAPCGNNGDLKEPKAPRGNVDIYALRLKIMQLESDLRIANKTIEQLKTAPKTPVVTDTKSTVPLPVVETVVKAAMNPEKMVEHYRELAMTAAARVQLLESELKSRSKCHRCSYKSNKQWRDDEHTLAWLRDEEASKWLRLSQEQESAQHFKHHQKYLAGFGRTKSLSRLVVTGDFQIEHEP